MSSSVLALMLIVFTGASMHGLVAHVYLIGYFVFYWLRERKFPIHLAGLSCLASFLLVVYFYGYHANPEHPSLAYIFLHPLAGVKYMSVLVGNPYAGGSAKIAFVHAMLVSCMAVWAFVDRKTIRNWFQGISVIYLEHPLVVIGFGILLMITLGRAGFGVGQALSSRYATFSILLSAGLFFYILTKQKVNPCVVRTIAVIIIVGFLTGIYTGNKYAMERSEILDEFKRSVMLHYPDLGHCSWETVYPDHEKMKYFMQIIARDQLSFFHKGQREDKATR